MKRYVSVEFHPHSPLTSEAPFGQIHSISRLDTEHTRDGITHVNFQSLDDFEHVLTPQFPPRLASLSGPKRYKEGGNLQWILHLPRPLFPLSFVSYSLSLPALAATAAAGSTARWQCPSVPGVFATPWRCTGSLTRCLQLNKVRLAIF